ncbi:hypothetical protein QIH15_27140, partial [Klebsiella pneumoniae]|nr:hypothetical protein [Klebsiella pneumoniae]
GQSAALAAETDATTASSAAFNTVMTEFPGARISRAAHLALRPAVSIGYCLKRTRKSADLH